jgi:hypothetical protein
VTSPGTFERRKDPEFGLLGMCSFEHLAGTALFYLPAGKIRDPIPFPIVFASLGSIIPFYSKPCSRCPSDFSNKQDGRIVFSNSYSPTDIKLNAGHIR